MKKRIRREHNEEEEEEDKRLKTNEPSVLVLITIPPMNSARKGVHKSDGGWLAVSLHRLFWLNRCRITLILYNSGSLFAVISRASHSPPSGMRMCEK